MIKKIVRGKRIPRVEILSVDASKDRDDKGAFLGLLQSEYQEPVKTEMKTDVELGMSFISAAESGDRTVFDGYIEAGHDVNFQDPRTGLTALHLAGGTSDKCQIRALVNSGRCNFLIRDKRGRLPSDVAFTNSVYPEIHRYLTMLERRQAHLNGVDLYNE